MSISRFQQEREEDLEFALEDWPEVDIPEFGRARADQHTIEVADRNWHITWFEERTLVSFTPAFRRRWARYKPKIIKSIGVCTVSARSPSGVRQRVEMSRGPSGYCLQAPTLQITLERQIVEDIFRNSSMNEVDNHSLISSLISFQTAHSLATYVEMNVELHDFWTSWSIESDTINLFVVDSISGGNGVSRQLFDDWSSSRSLLQASQIILSSCTCSGYCEKCILLPDTPEPYVRNGFLNRLNGLRLIS